MRNPGAVVALLVGLVAGLVLVGAPAHAQGPPAACELQLIEAADNPQTTGFAQGVPRTFEFVVTNTGSMRAGADVTISSPPPGWFWSTSLPRVDLEPGGSTTYRLHVEFQGPRAQQGFLDVTITDVVCQPGGLAITPVQGSNTDTLSFTLANAPLASPSDGEDTPWAWVVFGLLVLGTVIAVPLLYRGRRAAIEAFCEEPERTVVPARGTSFPIVLRNKVGRSVHVALEVTEVQTGWSALVTLPDLELGPKESRTIYMMVRAPAEARPGDLCVAKLTARPEGGSPQVVNTVTKVTKEGRSSTNVRAKGTDK